MDQLTLALAPEPDRRRARRRTHPAQPTTAPPPPRYRLIPIARLTVVTPEPGALVAEAGAPGVEACELGYARDPAAVAAVLAPYFAAVRADQEEFVILVLNARLRIVQLIPYGQNIRTCLPTGGDASTIARVSACVPLPSHPYSTSRGTAMAEREGDGL